MNPQLRVNLEVVPKLGKVPGQQEIEGWASRVIALCNSAKETVEVGVKLVDMEESEALNLQYRHKKKPTNVLSFPLHAPLENGGVLLGDLAICATVVRAEAKEQDKPEIAHWAHMIVHGMLHLLGYDHVEDNEAETMEAMERKILKDLGFADPY